MKQILSIFVGFLMLATAQAASFDCAKSITKVEKMICGDTELSKLDDDLFKAYRQSPDLINNKQKAINEQRGWLTNVRNTCQNTDCIKAALEARIHELTTLPIGSKMSGQEHNVLIGIWEAEDNAHRSIYGFLRITPTTIEVSLDGKQWECQMPYTVVKTGTDETYSDEIRPFPEKVRLWSYVKIRLDEPHCTNSSYFVFAFLPKYSDSASFVEFTDKFKWAGTGHFFRIGNYK